LRLSGTDYISDIKLSNLEINSQVYKKQKEHNIPIPLS